MRKLFLCTLFAPCCLLASPEKGWIVQGRVAAFLPQAKRFREIFNTGPYYQFQASRAISRPWELWTSLSFYGQSGHSIPLKSKCSVFLMPLGVGVNCVFPIADYWWIYFGAGGAAAYMHTHDHAVSNQPRNTNGFGGGGIFKFGLNRRYHRWQVDLFADYQMLMIWTPDSHRAQRTNVNASGFLIGIGLGKEF